VCVFVRAFVRAFVCACGVCVLFHPKIRYRHPWTVRIAPSFRFSIQNSKLLSVHC